MATRIIELTAAGKGDARERLEQALSFAPAAVEQFLPDIAEGSTVSFSATSGAHATRVFYLDGLVGAPAEILWAALGDNRIPQVGTTHPFIPFLPVDNASASLLDGFASAAKVVVQYGFQSGGAGGFDQDPDDADALPQIEVGSSMQTATTEFDRRGNVIRVRYTPPFDPEVDDPDIVGPPAPITRTVPVEYQAPMDLVVFRRRERSSPGLRSTKVKGHVNSRTVFGDPPRTWLCTMFDGTSDDGGATYNVSTRRANTA